jgi:multidrug efflux pump subunit AcrA (membrane-fusion protein)
MKRLILPAIGLLAALWATFSVVRTQPHRQTTDPPAPPPVSGFPEAVAAVGLVEASTENISVGTPLIGVVAGVFVTPGQTVRAGEPLFELDARHLRAELGVRSKALAVAQAVAGVARARLQDLTRQLEFAEQVRDKRAISAEELTRRRSAVETAAMELEEARAQVAAVESQVHAARVEIDRSTVRAPIGAEVLQVKLRVGEFAPAAPTPTALVLLGRPRPLHVRVDVDEHEAWRVRPGTPAVGHVRGNAELETPLKFVRFEPFVLPKKSLTGDSAERVDTAPSRSSIASSGMTSRSSWASSSTSSSRRKTARTNSEVDHEAARSRILAPAACDRRLYGRAAVQASGGLGPEGVEGDPGRGRGSAHGRPPRRGSPCGG